MNQTLSEIAQILLMSLGPLVLFAVVIHWLERFTQRRLAERFGWKSVLWTGWLGTPVHELSHALMCHAFGHRVDEIVLFEPDPESGRLGYVRHSYKQKNWFEEMGNFFIGIAPLVGGCIAMVILLWLFYPTAVHAAIQSVNSDPDATMWSGTMSAVTGLLDEVVTLEHVATIRFWVFLYLILCVGSHMAPSASDYRGGLRGGLVLGVIVLAVVAVLAVAVPDAASLAAGVVEIFSPLLAVLLLAVALCAVAAAVVFLLTAAFPRRFEVG